MACRRDGAPAGTARRRPARQREGTHTTTSASPFCGGADPNQLIKVVGCEVRRISMTQPADRLHSISSGIGIRTAANEFSARVLVNTGSSLIQAGIEEKKEVGQRTWDSEESGPWTSTRPTCIYSDLFRAGKLQMNREAPSSTNSNNSSADCKKLQQEMEICNRK